MSPFLEILTSAIPVVIMITIIGVILAGVYWRADTKRKMNEYLKNIREHDIAIKKYNGLMGKFNDFENTPPFSNQFDTILKKLAELHSNRDREMKLYSHLRGEIDEHNLKNIKNRLMAPWHWLQTHQKLNSLDHLDMIVATNVDAVGIDVHQLTHIQNEIARQITVAWQEIQELEQNIQVLMQRGVRADVISPYKHTFSRLRQRFSTIPAYLLTPSHTPPSNDDTLKHVAAAFTILEESRPLLEEPLINSRLWLELSELLPQAIAQVAIKADELQDKVLITSESINVSSFYADIKEARLAVEHGQQFSQRIDPNQLESVLEALTQQVEKLEESIQEIAMAGKVLEEYQGFRESLANQWYTIETLVPQLTENPVLPILFTETQEELDFLSASLQRLLDMRTAHTIVQFKEETPMLKEKISKIHQLQTDLMTMQSTQAELMTLVRRLQLPKLENWTQKTQTARTRLTEFSEENYFYPPSWQQLDLDAELEEINRQARESLPVLNQTIREEELLEMWQVAQNIDKMVAIIQDGLNNQLQQRKTLIEQEHTLRESHTVIFSQVNLLKGVQLEREKLRSVRHYFKRLEEIKVAISHREEGTVAEKEKQLKSLGKEISEQIEEWLREVQKEVLEQNASLLNLVNELDNHANLNDEIFAEINLFLEEEDFSQTPEVPELELIMELFLVSKDHQFQVAQYLNQLQPLHAELMQHISAYTQVQHTFKTTLAEAEGFIDFSNSWNQSVLNLDRIRKQGNQLEKEMNLFTNSSHHSQNLIRKLKQYTSRYEEQFQKMSALVNQIREEQTQQKEAEAGLQQVMEQWEQVARQWHEDQIVAENVENLLKRYQNRMRDTRTNYERGRIRFSSFIATINSLRKHLSFEVITNEENKSIEISGKEYI